MIIEDTIKRVEEDKDGEIKRLNNIADKLEQRIAKLEKVLESHAKCIGEMREDNPFLLREDEDES